MKNEILQALKDFRDIDYSDFEHTFEGNIIDSCAADFYTESENFNITFSLREYVRFSSHEDYEFEDIEIEDLIVINEDSERVVVELTDEEIENALGL